LKGHTVVVDGLSALQGGGQTYLINLFRFLPERFSQSLRVIAVIPEDGDVFRVNDQIEYVQSSFASGGLVRRMIWSKLSLPALLRKTSAQVLYCPGGFVSTFGSGWKTAVAFRNMLPFSDEERRRYPYGYTRTRLAILKYIQSRSFRKANLVVFMSQFAKSIIDIVVGPRAGTAVVIPHGVNDRFRRSGVSQAGLRLPDRYVAYVSIVTVYKAQLEVVRAWALMRTARRSSEALLLVGPSNQDYERKVRKLIVDLSLQDVVMLLGDVPYDALPAVYLGALANVFASSCENCPNILLEALAAGKPVLCSDYQPMPEFAGDAALYFDPYDPQSLATRLCEVLDDPWLAADLGRRSRERSAEFQWKRSAEATWQALSDLAGERQGH
jgi:glycosyltransferase involved in cell wall biosynthesis